MAKTDHIQIKYGLTFTTPFHCGTGLSSGIVDRTVVRDMDGYLYIPGSTFKGVIRSKCEQLARLYTFEDDSEMRQRIVSPHDEKQALVAMYGPITMITRIFGSRNRPGLLSFDDAKLPEREKQGDNDKRRIYDHGRDKVEQTDLHMQVRLDRRTRTAVGDVFYTNEFGLRDLTFYGSISGWLNCTAIEGVEGDPSYSLLLLLAGLYMLDRLGGSKSTGKGQCACEITSLSINMVEFPDATRQFWLEHLDMLMFYSENAGSEEEEW